MSDRLPEYEPVPFPWRQLIYGVILLYLLVDLLVVKGPVRKWIDKTVQAESISTRAERFGYASVVNTVPITCEQVERAAREHLARSGRTLEDLDSATRRMVMVAVLDRLKRSRTVSRFAHFAGAAYRPDAPKTEDHLARLAATLPEGEKDIASRVAGIGLEAHRHEQFLRKNLVEAAWVESEIADAIKIQESEIEEWYQQNLDDYLVPERIRLRHLFLTTADPDRPDARERIQALHRQLQNGASFSELATKHSNDPRSKRKGGDLGWVTRDRIPATFAETAFALPTAQLSEPLRSPLGWHLVIVDEKRPARPAELSEVQDEIRGLLESQRRKYAVKELLCQMDENTTIIDFPEVFEAHLATLEN